MGRQRGPGREPTAMRHGPSLGTCGIHDIPRGARPGAGLLFLLIYNPEHRKHPDFCFMTRDAFGVFNSHLQPLSFPELPRAPRTRSDTRVLCPILKGFGPQPSPSALLVTPSHARLGHPCQQAAEESTTPLWKPGLDNNHFANDFL